MTGAPPDGALAVARLRLGDELAAAGRRYAAFAATVLICRGRLLLDPVAFARVLGVPAEHVHSLESGRRPPAHAPRRLVALAPDLDWGGVGVDAASPGDPARRHPSTGQVRARLGENGPP